MTIGALGLCVYIYLSVCVYINIQQIYLFGNNRACWWVSHNAWFRNSQTHSVNDSIKYFDRVFLQVPVKNCYVGMFLYALLISGVCDGVWHITHLNTWYIQIFEFCPCKMCVPHYNVFTGGMDSESTSYKYSLLFQISRHTLPHFLCDICLKNLLYEIMHPLTIVFYTESHPRVAPLWMAGAKLLKTN